MRFPILCFILAVVFLTLGAKAQYDIKVHGMHQGQVVLTINGKVRYLVEGQTAPEGITLVRVGRREIKLAQGSKFWIYALNRAKKIVTNTGGGSIVTAGVAVIERDESGMYVTQAMINGQQVNMLVDTGATVVTISEGQAAQLGIEYSTRFTSTALTANGERVAYPTRFKSVTVGGITLQNVSGIILQGDDLSVGLLGMSFLGQVKRTDDGKKLTLSIE